MSAPNTAASATTLISSRLFGGEQSNLDDWIEQNKAHAESSAAATKLKPLQLSSHPSQNDDKASMMQLCENVTKTGFALYQWDDEPIDVPESVSRLLQALSLHNGDQGVIRETDQLSLLQDLSGTPKGRFPPYQAKAMNWHTDGYYNDAAETVRCFTLHCVAPAAVGGALLLMDDVSLVYTLYKEDPELVALLSHPKAMTLPHNKDNDGHDRPDRIVPVISRNTDNSISMRFTTRSQHIQWRCNATQAAARHACELINAHPQLHTRITLQRGQGIITRNVLHAREAFVDEPGKPKRQMLRGRFTNLPVPAMLTGLTDTSANNAHVAR